MRNLLASLLLPAVACAHTLPPTSNPTSPTKPIAAAGTFDARIYGALGATKGNVALSPASILAALAMTREGARGATADEMDRVLDPSARELAKALMKSLQSSSKPDADRPPPELAIANRLFADRMVKLVPEFADVTRRDYAAGVEPVDFRGAAEAAREQINAWVADVTHGRIRDLLPRGVVDEATRLVLVDAIYLRASWATPFERATAPAPFAVTGDATKDVATMHGAMSVATGALDHARVIDLPYAANGGPQLGMLIAVPDDASTLADVEAAYARAGIQPLLHGLGEPAFTTVALPKFEVGSRFELVPALEQLGMQRAFGDDADFSGIATSDSLKISNVIHQAWVKVDEKGTEAAAATAVVMRPTAVMLPAKSFAVDRSFLFFIHDASGNVLFAGRIADPSAG